MNVVVPTPELGCPAHKALSVERVFHLETLLGAVFSYAELWQELWDRGFPWVNVEWDIAPWPGAIDQLAQCDHSWCAIPYPIGQADDLGDNCITGLGCMKITPQGPLDVEGVRWDRLDGQVIPALNRMYRQPHVHWPPVAHCRSEPAN